MKSTTYTDEQLQFIVEKGNDAKLTWADVAEAFEEKFGVKKSANAVRKLHTVWKDHDFSEDEFLKNIRSSHTVRKSNSKLRKENKVILDQLDIQEQFLDEFEDILKSHPIKVHKPIKHKKTKKAKKRTIFAHLSDNHIHAMIDEEELGGLNKYGAVEEARRLAYFIREVANYKLHHRDETDLVLAINGDTLQGIIHDQESTPLMTTQFSAGLHLLTQTISYLAQHFSNVKVVCTTGNHARFLHKNNKGRQTDSKWDGFHTCLHVSLKYALKDHTNVEFVIPVTPYAIIDIQGHKYFVTHGDTVVSPGNVGKSISTEGLKNKLNDLMSGLGHIDVAVFGHVHVPCYTTLNNGIELVVNGTMSGIDPFAQAIGILKNNPCQQLFEITEDQPVGDMRFVRLGDADSEKELDKIIEPFRGKF